MNHDKLKEVLATLGKVGTELGYNIIDLVVDDGIVVRGGITVLPNTPAFYRLELLRSDLGIDLMTRVGTSYLLTGGLVKLDEDEEPYHTNEDHKIEKFSDIVDTGSDMSEDGHPFTSRDGLINTIYDMTEPYLKGSDYNLSLSNIVITHNGAKDVLVDRTHILTKFEAERVTGSPMSESKYNLYVRLSGQTGVYSDKHPDKNFINNTITTCKSAPTINQLVYSAYVVATLGINFDPEYYSRDSVGEFLEKHKSDYKEYFNYSFVDQYYWFRK